MAPTVHAVMSIIAINSYRDVSVSISALHSTPLIRRNRSNCSLLTWFDICAMQLLSTLCTQDAHILLFHMYWITSHHIDGMISSCYVWHNLNTFVTRSTPKTEICAHLVPMNFVDSRCNSKLSNLVCVHQCPSFALGFCRVKLIILENWDFVSFLAGWRNRSLVHKNTITWNPKDSSFATFASVKITKSAQCARTPSSTSVYNVHRWGKQVNTQQILYQKRSSVHM